MSTESLRQMYESVRGTEDVSNILRFKQELLSRKGQGDLEFHYELLEDLSDLRFYRILRAAFVERGQEIEDFLLRKLPQEHRKHMRLDVVQMLGSIRSSKAIPIAKELLSCDDSESRYCGCIVLGWVGCDSDIDLIHNLLCSDASPQVRSVAASALRQIWFRFPDIQSQVIEVLGEALRAEIDEDAVSVIIVCLQSLMKKRFGLKENIQERKIEGSPAIAKEKALKCLGRTKTGKH